MNAKLLRQWEGGGIFAAVLLGLDAVGIFCLILFTVKGGFSFGLLLPACLCAVGLYYVRHFFSLWRTTFLVSENGITMIDRNRDACRSSTLTFSPNPPSGSRKAAVFWWGKVDENNCNKLPMQQRNLKVTEIQSKLPVGTFASAACGG